MTSVGLRGAIPLDGKNYELISASEISEWTHVRMRMTLFRREAWRFA